MKLLDTNILVRLFTNDIPTEAKNATVLLSEGKVRSLVVTDAVLSELCFVLQFNNYYLYPRERVGRCLEVLVKTPSVALSRIAKEAIIYFLGDAKLDMTDCLLLAQAKIESAEIVTLDKHLAKRAIVS